MSRSHGRWRAGARFGGCAPPSARVATAWSRQLLTESVLLALAGGAAVLRDRVCRKHAPPALAQNQHAAATRPWSPIGGPVLLFGTIVSLCTGIAFGLIPALDGSRTELHAALAGGGRSTGRSNQCPARARRRAGRTRDGDARRRGPAGPQLRRASAGQHGVYVESCPRRTTRESVAIEPDSLIRSTSSTTGSSPSSARRPGS